MQSHVLIYDDCSYGNRFYKIYDAFSGEPRIKRYTLYGRTLFYFFDEMSDITWIQAFQMMLQMFRTLLADQIDISDEKIDELVYAFIDATPALLKSKLQAA